MKELIQNNNFDNIKYIIENDTLYLDVESIHDLSGAPVSTIKDNCKQVLEEYLAYSNFSRNFGLSLYIEKSTGGRPRRFYSHYIVGDVLHRLKSPQAIKFRIWANEKTFRTPEPETNHIDVVEFESTISNLQDRRKGDADLLSRLYKRSRLLDQNGDTEELERLNETILDISNEFNEITILISDATKLVDSSKTVTKLSPKVNNNKYWNQNHLIPFKKS